MVTTKPAEPSAAERARAEAIAGFNAVRTEAGWERHLVHIVEDIRAAEEAARDSEREECCKHLCEWCRNDPPPALYGAVIRKAELRGSDTFGHEWAHFIRWDNEQPDGYWRQCDAAAIRERGSGGCGFGYRAKARRKQPNPTCGFCFGAWNGMDRWFMQECSCARPCAEAKCKARRRR